MRKTFSILFLCCFLCLCDLPTGSLGRCAELPAAVFFKARIKLKNGDVIKKQNYLFTKVNLKPSAGSSSSLAESKASLYAQRNFAKYLFGQINWNEKFTPTELHLIQALYGQVASFSGILRGLTLIQSSSQNGSHVYIYAVNVSNKTEIAILLN